MGNLSRKLFYIFLLGLSTYAWWHFNAMMKRKLEEAEKPPAKPGT